MNIFVSGATGFIGSHFTELALREGHKVIALRRSSAVPPRIPLTREPEWICKTMVDVTNEDFSGVDVIVHLAARGVTSLSDPIELLINDNVVAPLTLFRNAVQANVKYFVIAGSCFEYGRSAERYDFIPIDAPLEPTNAYAASKAAATLAFTAFAQQTAVTMQILRIFHVFGEGENETRLWPSLRKAAINGEDFPMTRGDQVRDFITVERVARALLSATKDNSVPLGVTRILNLGTGRPQTIREFAENWWSHWNAKGKLLVGKIPYRHNEVMRYVGQT